MSSASIESIPRSENADGAGVLDTISTISSPAIEAENLRRVLSEEDAYQVLGFSFSTIKKWSILTSIFIVQISMNFNAAIYGNAVSGMSTEFGISEKQAKIGQMIFLVS